LRHQQEAQLHNIELKEKTAQLEKLSVTDGSPGCSITAFLEPDEQRNDASV
jgi:hypothetical protein